MLFAIQLPQACLPGVAPPIGVQTAPAAPGRRGHEVIQRAFFDENLVLRVSGDTIAVSPPLIVSESDLSNVVERIRRVLQTLA